MVSAVTRKIAEDSKLFDLRTKDTGRIHQSHAGAFFVMKTNNKLRVIVDGRVLNSFFNDSLAKFSLFTPNRSSKSLITCQPIADAALVIR